MREVRIALFAGLALVAVGIVVALARSPLSVARVNGTPKEEERIAVTAHDASFCQAGELLPGDTSAIRLWWFAYAGPRVRVVVYSGGRAVTSGERAAGWTSRAVTVPVKPLASAVSGATVCASVHLRDEQLTVFGKATPAAVAAHDGRKAAAGRMWIEYLRPGRSSWASMVSTILGHMAFGHAAPGGGLVLLLLVLAVAVATLASRLLLRELSS